MQHRKRSADGCLSDETLAAYVDGGLTADERAQVELHLAACQDCFAVFTESVRTVQAMADSGEFDQPVSRTPVLEPPVPTVVLIKDGRRRRVVRWAAAGAGLAAAAAVALAVWWPRPEPADLAFARLVVTLGDRRTTTGRITGVSRWAPEPVLLRSEQAVDVSAELRAAAALVEQAAARSGTIDADARAAASLLIVGEADRAIDVFSRVTTLDPEVGRYWSDLSAAYLERYRRRNDIADAKRAREAAERATRLAPTLPEAWFNLALASAADGNVAAARQAVQRLATLAPDSPWTREARDRVARPFL